MGNSLQTIKPTSDFIQALQIIFNYVLFSHHNNIQSNSSHLLDNHATATERE